VTVTRQNNPGSFTETLTYAYTPVSGVTTPTGTDTISSSNIQSLSRQLTSAGGQMIESDQYFNLSGVTYSASSFHLGAANVNYYATTYGYDTDGNQNKVVDPNGTITRTVYDGQGRVVSTWVGTSDTPTSGYWSPTNNAGSNMVEVSSNVYDNGGVGDSNLTESIQYPNGATGERATLNYYDWQDRLVASKQGAAVNSSGTPTPSAETDGVNRPITYTIYDNLNEPIEQDTYDGDGVSITATGGVPNAPSSSLLVAKTTTSYDDQGRVYQTDQYSVDPTSGAVGDALVSNTFYDHDGNVIAQSDPSGTWTKTTYDGADRPIESYTTDGGVLSGATIGWATADSVANDVVLSQIDTTYDGDGNVILTADRERLPGDPQTGTGSTGALGNMTGSGGPAANVYYTAMYYDDADRQAASVNVGTNGGSAYTPPSTVPASSDSTLVTTTAYGADGLPSVVTDPRGIESLTEYDLLGRTTETIAAWDGTSSPTPTSDTNQITLYTYDGDGNETSMTAVQPSGTPNQTTDYIYGVAGGTSGIFSNDLLATVEYPDATTGDASTSAADDVTYTYDALGEQTSMTDQNGTTHDYSYDVLGRQTLDSVATLGSGVDGTVMALGTNYNSQGLPYQETSYSNANGTGVVNQDQDVYNGLGQLTGEYQSVSGAVNTSSTPEVQYAYSDPDIGSRLTSMTYPNGRVVDYVYNSGIDTTIGRVSAIADAGGSASGTLQSYSYQGLSTIVGETDGNGVTETTTLDPFGRTAELKYVNPSSVVTDDFQYGYDRDGNVLYQNNLLDSSGSQLYHSNSTTTGDDNTAYDPLNRLTGFEQGALSASGNNGSTLDTASSPNASQSWNLNAVGDQNSVTTNGTTTTNSTNAKNELTTNGAAGLTYDNDGNTLTDENGQTYTYDAWNRQVTAKNSGGTTIATYIYDPTGRRITDTEGGTTTDIYYSYQWQDIEERQGGTVTRQNVWGLAYVNQLVERDDNSTSGNLGITGSGLGERLYAQQDENWSVTSLVDNSGNVVERMTYLPYGAVTFLTASWSPTTDAYSQNVLFQGGRLETATGLYDFQYRDENPQTGTWAEQDPAGYINGADTYQLEVSNPATLTDAKGLTFAAALSALGNGFEGAGVAEAVGLGPADPVADLAATGLIVGGIGYGVYQLFQPSPGNTSPTGSSGYGVDTTYSNGSGGDFGGGGLSDNGGLSLTSSSSPANSIDVPNVVVYNPDGSVAGIITITQSTGSASSTNTAPGSTAAVGGQAPAPNGGNSPKHGGDAHEDAIQDKLDELRNNPNAKNIRKNQCQVDVNGNRVGNNRPDLQWDENGVHNNWEVDNDPAQSSAHAQQIQQNDPNSAVTQKVLGK
jgi:RHS repeat-associated protein